MVLNWIKMLASIDDVILRQDPSNCLIASSWLNDCVEHSIKVGDDGSREELWSQVVAGLLLCMSLCEWNILCPVD